MRPCRGVLALGWLVACACGGATRAPEARPAARADDAVEVAALLPERVERCVVARPRRLAARRRRLVLFQSWAEPRAFSAELPVVAYASALAEGRGGRRARRTYLRFAERRDALEARVRELPVRWLDEPCEGRACRRPVARWIDARTVEIARYAWPRRALPLSSGACVQLARLEPRAFEVAVDATVRMGSLPVPEPRARRRVLRVDDGALVTRRELSFADAVEARVYDAWIRGRARVPEVEVMPLGPSRRRIEQRDERVIVRDERLWEELELALEDERLRRQALALSQRRAEPAPLARVDVTNLAVVRHQVRLRRAALERRSGAARLEAARELAVLLERAWAAHPGELELARTLVRLELDPLGRPARAVEHVERVLQSGVAGAVDRWRLLRREALSHAAAAELAAALAEDGVVDGAEATDAAEDLVALRAAGVPYEWAESAWRMSRHLAARRGPREPASARLPWEGTLGALVGLARLRGSDRRVTVQLAVHTPHRTRARAVGESRPELVVVRGPGEGSTVVGALPSADLVALRRMGRALAELVPPGPLRLAVELRDPDTGALERLQVAGARQGEDLVLERVGPGLSDVPWAAVGRYLARPLAELPTALFPPPELTVRAESAEVAAALRREAELPGRGVCRIAGPILRCRAPGRPAQLGELLLSLVRGRIAPASRAGP